MIYKMGKPIFRFRQVTDYLIKSLMDNTIYATTPNSFNDPYDTLFQFDTDGLYELLVNDEESLDYLSEELLIEFKKGMPNYTIDEAKKLVKNKDFYLPQVNNFALNIIDILRREMLLYAFVKIYIKK